MRGDEQGGKDGGRDGDEGDEVVNPRPVAFRGVEASEGFSAGRRGGLDVRKGGRGPGPPSCEVEGF